MTVDCREAQELILDDQAASARAHISLCLSCAALLQQQEQLHQMLQRSLPVPSLKPEFPAHLRARIRRQPSWVWADWLPEATHVTGGIVSTGLCAWLLPLPAGIVVWYGLAFTAVGYAAQFALRLLLEEGE